MYTAEVRFYGGKRFNRLNAFKYFENKILCGTKTTVDKTDGDKDKGIVFIGL